MTEALAVPAVVMLGRIEVVGSASSGGDPTVFGYMHVSGEVQAPSAGDFAGLGDDFAGLHDLQAVDGQDGLGAGANGDGSAAFGQAQGVADVEAVHREFEQRAAAEVGAAGGHVAAPGVVVEGLALRQADVGAVEPDGDVGRHLVGAAGQREPVAAVEVAVVLHVGEWLLAQHFHCIHTAGGDEGGGFAVGAGQVGDDDVAALGVGGVGPMGEGDFQRAAGFGFAGAVGAPGHDRFLEAEQGEVAEEVLPVFLGDVDDGAAVV